MASKEEIKAERERKVFALFGTAQGWLTPNHRIESRPPPEPDILFKRPWHRAKAVEIVEFIDQDYARVTGADSASRTELNNRFSALSSEERQRIEHAFKDAEITVSFPSVLSERKWTAIFKRLFKFLLALPPDWSGVALKPTELQPYVNEVIVARGAFKGPMFDVSSAVWVDDPCVELIAGKVHSSYATSYPMELLAYIESNPMFPDYVWMQDLQDYCRSMVGCQFQAIYVFDVSTQKVRFTWKRPTLFQRLVRYLADAGRHVVVHVRTLLERRA